MSHTEASGDIGGGDRFAHQFVGPADVRGRLACDDGRSSSQIDTRDSSEWTVTEG